jgi:alkanesulfonate monooxygenase SsuD/methylene tetrahydromethanopterin reductase-like flavin-dependent oxidoreductase (luciferase family)
VADLRVRRQRCDRSPRPRAVPAYARAADELGLDVFALGEHDSLDFRRRSPAVVLATIAGQTERIRLAGRLVAGACRLAAMPGTGPLPHDR